MGVFLCLFKWLRRINGKIDSEFNAAASLKKTPLSTLKPVRPCFELNGKGMIHRLQQDQTIIPFL